MKVQRGKFVKLLPTHEQEQLFWKFAGTRRFVYNWALKKQMDAFENEQPFISANELCREIVTLKKTHSDYMWLRNISCDVPKQAIKDLDVGWHRYFKKQKEPNYVPYSKQKIEKSKRTGKSLTVYDRNGHPKFKSKLNTTESFHQDCMHVQFNGAYMFVAKIGWVKIANSNVFPQGQSGKNFKIYNAKIKYDGKNWYFVAAMDIEVNYNNVPKTEPIGIDLGVKDLAILSNGTKYKNINKTHKVKKLEKRKRKLQKKVSKKYQMNKKGNKYVKTNNILKMESKVLTLSHKLKNIRKNYLHKTTSEIVKREPIYIAMEDLNVQGMMKNKHLSKAIQDQGISLFKTYISYKCQAHNIPIYFVDRFYPSSKTCSCCGFIKKNLKLSDRIYHCPNCNTVIDRDINAAINLRNKGQEFYNKSIIQVS